VSDVGWLFVAFLAAWGIIGVYVILLGNRQRKLEDRVDALDRSRN
jgi:CcmD family protein